MQTPALILEAKHHHRPSPEKATERGDRGDSIGKTWKTTVVKWWLHNVVNPKNKPSVKSPLRGRARFIGFNHIRLLDDGKTLILGVSDFLTTRKVLQKWAPILWRDSWTIRHRQWDAWWLHMQVVEHRVLPGEHVIVLLGGNGHPWSPMVTHDPLHMWHIRVVFTRAEHQRNKQSMFLLWTQKTQQPFRVLQDRFFAILYGGKMMINIFFGVFPMNLITTEWMAQGQAVCKSHVPHSTSAQVGSPVTQVLG